MLGTRRPLALASGLTEREAGERLARRGPLVEARTVATTALIAIGLYFVLVLEASGSRRGPTVSALVLALAAAYALVLLWPWSREFFALATPTPAILATAAGGSAFVLTALWLADARFAPGRAHEAE